jgi:protein-S-isoprenylcysteine O-methyltransferase Ste14
MSDSENKSWTALLWLFAVMTTIIFVSAGTLQYWQAWLYLAVFFTSSIAITFYLMKNDPRLLERRSKGGPMAEGTTTQRIIMTLASAGFAALLIVPALDRRFGWSKMPALISLLGNVLFVMSYLAIMRVFKENTFAASTITIEAGQQVISTGPYSHVRHPMYAAGIVLLAASPLALGSWWGLIVLIPLLPVLIWRLLDEEEFLRKNLAGYDYYCQRVKSRLIPSVW